MTKNNFPATVVIIIIIFGAIFALSGLCTGVFAWNAEIGGGDAYSPNHWYEAVMIGSVALVPSGLMLWAAIRQARLGNNKVSGVILLIAGVLITLYGLMSTLGNTFIVASIIFGTPSGFGSTGSVILFALAILTLAAGLWLLRVAIKILRNKPLNDISPEIFD